MKEHQSGENISKMGPVLKCGEKRWLTTPLRPTWDIGNLKISRKKELGDIQIIFGSPGFQEKMLKEFYV